MTPSSPNRLNRRHFLRTTAAATAGAALGGPLRAAENGKQPNILYVFSDQWRATDHGYSGNAVVITPHLDGLAKQCVNFTHAVSGIPVCCPHRASLLTGKRPLTHGLFLNDLYLAPTHRSVAHCLNDAGYQTGYIGKWHIDGHGRMDYTPPERRQGFQFWKALECTHDYNHSHYYTGSNPKRMPWEGYEPMPQTDAADAYLKSYAQSGQENPFALFLSWGPPHAPYQTAPEKYHQMYPDGSITLRKNVPEEQHKAALENYRGYYAHMTALDECMGQLLRTLEETGLAENTILVYTSDHGDMLHSRGFMKKQQPWDESLRVPFLVRWPSKLKNQPREIDSPIDTPDIMPTLLGLAGAAIPGEVDGRDLSGVVLGTETADPDYAALITCPSPFGQWSRDRGGREYRGLRTTRYTYCRDLDGPWLLYDNAEDPFQMNNLVGNADFATLQKEMDERLNVQLAETHDEFLPGPELIRRCGYVVNPKNETVDYHTAFNPANTTKSPLG